MTLSSLAPRRGELLWDIGAGSGSVAIEWMLADPSSCAPSRSSSAPSARRASGATPPRFGVPGLDVVRRRARRQRSQSLPPPDAIFIGGGAERCRRARGGHRTRCAPGGRLVVNAVTLETEALLDRAARELGGELIAHRHCARRAGRQQDRLAAGDAGDAMAVGQAMIVAGIGCRRGAAAPAIEDGDRARARARATRTPSALDCHRDAASKARRSRDCSRGDEARRAARSCRPGRELEAASATHGNALRARVVALTGVPSLAEAAALAAGRPRGTPARAAPRDRRRDLRARRFGGAPMTVHFIGAGPGAADLITVRGRDLSRAARSASMPARSSRAICSLIARPARASSTPRRCRSTRSKPNSSPRTPPATTWRGCIPAISRSTARWPSSCAGSSGAASPIRSRPACPLSPPRPRRSAASSPCRKSRRASC